MSDSIRDKVFNISNKIIKSKNYINRNEMIYLEPNYKFIESDEILKNDKFDYAFYTDLENIKKIKDLTAKNLISTKYPYLVLIKNKSPSDNVLLLIKTPEKEMKGGVNSQFTNNEVGKGFNPDIVTKNQGIDLGQYRAPTVPVNKLPRNLQKHDHNQYPADQMFENREMEALIEKERDNYKNYEDGFGSGFDNGYGKGYYFGYSAASAYLYRFYKKYYSDYMNKYELKLKEYNDGKLKEQQDKITKEKKEFMDNILVNNNVNPITLKQNEESIFEEQYQDSIFLADEEEDNEESIFYGGYKMTGGHKMNFFEVLRDMFKRKKKKIEYYDYDKLDTQDEYEGLPIYMQPSNVLSLETLQPNKKGIFHIMDLFLDPPPIKEDPDRHCYKPKKKDLNFTVRQLFHPKYRDAIVSSSKSWDQKYFDRSCNRRALKVMKYCPHNKHVGVEFDPKVGKFRKVCKRDKDEEYNPGGLFVLAILSGLITAYLYIAHKNLSKIEDVTPSFEELSGQLPTNIPTLP